MHPVARLVERRRKTVIGLMSGTSLDGVDAALVEIEGFGADTQAELVAFVTEPYSTDERAWLQSLLAATTPELAAANARLGARFADAAQAVLRAAGREARDVDLVGSHGQTVWHAPPSTGVAWPATLQIGEPAVIAARLGVPVVGDFRVADVALGGEGAPLVPWVDWALFREPGRKLALQNIGGIANVTFVVDQADQCIAFDNGPGNMMLDAFCERAFGVPFDDGGRLAAQGRVIDAALAALMADPYLQKAPPKSTGREYYGRAAVDDFAARHAGQAPHDLLRTLTAFTAAAIADGLRFLPSLPDELRVSGGGARNPTLLGELRARTGVAVAPFAASVGLPAHPAFTDAKEAIAFAVLAVAHIHAVAANLPRVTGASRPAILGKLCLP